MQTASESLQGKTTKINAKNVFNNYRLQTQKHCLCEHFDNPLKLNQNLVVLII